MEYKVLDRLLDECNLKIKGGLYHKTQVTMSYDTNRIEGSTLTQEQTRHIFETHSFLPDNNDQIINVNDIIETQNHFKAFDYMLMVAKLPLDERIIKEFHRILKGGTSDTSKGYPVGEYKIYPNEIGLAGVQTIDPNKVEKSIKQLISNYNDIKTTTIEDIVDFHQSFESIHPFQDGNGRVGRLIMFKECLKNNITPFIIDSNHKLFYYRGLQNYNEDKTQLRETCLSAQDKYKAYCEYFKVPIGLNNLIKDKLEQNNKKEATKKQNTQTKNKSL